MHATAPGVDSTSLPLPPLDAPCRKCGGEGRHVVWFPAGANEIIARSPVPPPYDEPREHLSVTCQTCGFCWPAAPLDTHPAA